MCGIAYSIHPYTESSVLICFIFFPTNCRLENSEFQINHIHVFTSSIFWYQGLVKLCRLSGEDLDIYLWWVSLAAKLSVSVRMGLVIDMYIDVKMEMRTNTLGIPFPFLDLFWIILPRLSPEMRRFEYSGIRREYCEGTACSSLLG